jgi:hypothetical protein
VVLASIQKSGVNVGCTNSEMKHIVIFLWRWPFTVPWKLCHIRESVLEINSVYNFLYNVPLSRFSIRRAFSEMHFRTSPIPSCKLSFNFIRFDQRSCVHRQNNSSVTNFIKLIWAVLEFSCLQINGLFISFSCLQINGLFVSFSCLQINIHCHALIFENDFTKFRTLKNLVCILLQSLLKKHS